jgi:formate dehydrogenase iron-sulfur subunit
MSPIVVYVPIDTAARSVGADEVAAAILAEAARRNIEITLVRNGTRGMLWLEPLVEIATAKGRIAYGPVDVGHVSGLFDAGFITGGAHKLCHGVTDELPWLKNQERLTFARLGITAPLSADDYVAHGGIEGLKAALALTPAQIIAQVTDSGLRGRGGAGFPAGIKWNTVAQAVSDEKFICCNADEGDSGTFADRMVMEDDPFMLIEGMVIAGMAVGATQGYIYLRSEYPQAASHLNQAIASAHERKWLGRHILGSPYSFELEVRIGAGAYVCGEETAMLESIEGKRGVIRAKPPIPALKGLWNQPTVVNNVLTLASVPIILAKGGTFYKNFGVGRSLGTQPFQLAGNIKQGGLVEKAFGITLDELINGFGGGTLSGKPIRAVQVGGPLGAYVPAQNLHGRASYEGMVEIGAILGHGGIVVFDETVNMAHQARFALEFCAEESCGKCTPCRIGSTRGVEVMDRIMAGDNVDDNLALIEDLCEVLAEGSLCAMGGLTPLPVRSAIKFFPEDFTPSAAQSRQVA